MMPEFPRWHFFERNISGSAKFTQGIETDGIERLNPAILERRQSAELADMKFAILLWCKVGNDFRREQRYQQPRQNFGHKSHAALRLLTKPNRCWPNCTISPSATNAHEK